MPNLRRTVVAPNYPGANKRFYNSNFRVLLIMQFNKLLITISPRKIVTVRQRAQCQVEFADVQRHTEH